MSTNITYFLCLAKLWQIYTWFYHKVWLISPSSNETPESFFLLCIVSPSKSTDDVCGITLSVYIHTNSEYHHYVNSRFELFRKTRHKNSGDISTLLSNDFAIRSKYHQNFCLVFLNNSNFEFTR